MQPCQALRDIGPDIMRDDAGLAMPSASMSARMSAAWTSAAASPEGFSDGFSLSPKPRRSGAITSKSRARSGMHLRQTNQNSGQPCSKSSGGPRPSRT